MCGISRSTRTRFVAAFGGRSPIRRLGRPAAPCHEHLLRRRHALADAAADGRRDPRRDRAGLGVAPSAEVTLEANPTSVEAERFQGFRAAGVNRVSLGVQALNDADLRRLGRMHSARRRWRR